MATSDLEKLARVRRLIAEGEARRLREQAGVTLSEVAGASRVDTATVWRWENGQRRPRGDIALRYLKVLDRLAALQEEATA